jgi:hypothetical protein
MSTPWSDDPLARLAQIEAELRRVQSPEVLARIEAAVGRSAEEVRRSWERSPGTRLYRVRQSFPHAHLRGCIGTLAAWHLSGEGVDFVVVLPPVGQATLPIGSSVPVEHDALEPVSLTVAQRRAAELAHAMAHGPSTGVLIELSDAGTIRTFVARDRKVSVVAPRATLENLVLARERIDKAIAQACSAPREERVITPGSLALPGGGS